VWQDGERILCRGWRDGADGGRRAVLAVLPAAEHPTPPSLDRLAHEYGLKDELDGTWAARPLELVRERGRTMLVLEDPGGEPLDRHLGAPMEVGSFLHLAIGAARALANVHRRSLVHKDVKPANILVNWASGEIRLTGFGIASRLPRERPSPGPPEFIAGTLAYMAPEQTGRMNRSIDSRSDLYSLGVTLYQTLTGSLPFTASDAMEWVHCHIARKPVPPGERSKNVPALVSAIVMKLLAKTAEERYQTAAGLEWDLRHCLAEWEAHGRIDHFPLGERDTPNRLLIPEKLYGRAGEIKTLLASFERVVTRGAPALVLVSGYSGIGKSSVVNELHKVLVPPRGLFAAGKFDQYKHDIPYATLAQALQNLVRPLLGKSEGELAVWRRALHQALDPNGLLISNLIPELELIIGAQPPVSDLPAQEARTRFQSVFRRFIAVFARPEHPLALFLDDLQWLDMATLELLEDLLTQRDVQHLMCIGAYRDNEVDPAHPLMRRVEAIRNAGAIVEEITLAPLTAGDLGQLIADSLRCEPARATSLAQVVHEKTGGNPFFAVQFIHALAEEGLLAFDHGDARWSWNLHRIRAEGYTDTVVNLMVGKLHRFSAATRQSLQHLACLGNVAQIATLCIVRGTSEQALHADLWEAVRQELVLRLEDSYRFVHDRVQEAAYSLIQADLRAEAHLRIGRLLAARTPREKREEAIFEIVNQLNRGATLITSRDEREQLAELNLLAGKRARASTAYTSAFNYLAAGADLLTADCWERRHDLIFQLELLRAECEFLIGDLGVAEERLAALSHRAVNTVEQAAVACLRLDLYTALDQTGRAVAVGLEYLRNVGIEWAVHPAEEEGQLEYDRIWSQLGNRAIEELIVLPLMSDPASLATLDVLTKLDAPALLTDLHLFSLTVCRAVNLSLAYGNSDGSCFAYVRLGMLAGPRFGNYDAGYRFGRLGYELVEHRGLKRFQARTYLSFGAHVLPWTKHVRDGRSSLQSALDTATKIGDITFAAYTCAQLNTNMLAAGDPLVEVQREAELHLEFAQKVRVGFVVELITAQLQLVRTLRGLIPKFGSFEDEGFGELCFERRLSSNPAMALPECRYWIGKLQARFFAGDSLSAVDASLRAHRLLWTSPSRFEVAEYHFYGALSRAMSWDLASVEQRQQHFEALAGHHRQLELWAANCPENFTTRARLAGAEIARIEGRDLDAMRLYEKAIQSAKANDFVHNEGIANELAARFYATRGFTKIAHAYLRDARYCYLRWGADGKVRQLDQLYPDLVEAERLRGGTGTILAPVEHLDLATIIKVSQAVAGEIVLEKLIDTLMRTAIEHAGAERGVLILLRDHEHRIVAEAVTGGESVIVHVRDASMTRAALPESLVHYVMRARESVILEDASVENTFSGDAYIQQHRARSILCLPLINQAQSIGVLYLENSLIPHVFTSTRIAVLKLLASQAAISLENTRLYRDLEEREAKIRRLVDANIIGIFLWDAEGEIIEANDAFLDMVQQDRADLRSGLRWTELTPADWRDLDERGVAQLKSTGTVQPHEKEFLRKDGSRVPVLIGAAAFGGRGEQGVAFVVDLTERKRAEREVRESERRYQEVQMELAHANRVATMGQLSASISHEMNQPIAAAATNAQAALRWLGARPPNLAEVREALRRIVENASRASDVIGRIRALIKKAPPRKDGLAINDAILEVIALTRGEMVKTGVAVETQLAQGLPLIHGDRVQLQQVVLNLIVNALEAMDGAAEGSRRLLISTSKPEPNGVLVAVGDTGPGLAPDRLERAFEAFYTTKPSGLGMGLSISRSIVEAHGGRLWATANLPQGAVFQFTVPTNPDLAS
jgi:PAS domain S-box-containing protein